MNTALNSKTLVGVKEAFRDWYKSNTTDYKAHKIVAEFIGIQKTVIPRWGNGKQKPMGLTLIKLCFLMEAMGYNIEEFSTLNPTVKEINRIIAANCLSDSDVIDLTGFGRYTIIQTLAGHREPTANLGAKLTEIAASAPEAPQVLSDQIKIVLEKLASRQVIRASEEKLKSDEPPEVSEGVEPVLTAINGNGHGPYKPTPIRTLKEIQPTAEPATIKIEGWTDPSKAYKKWQIEQLAVQIKIMLPLAAYVESGKCTKADRETLRELAGDGAVFQLSNLLNKLCSEDARRNFNAT